MKIGSKFRSVVALTFAFGMGAGSLGAVAAQDATPAADSSTCVATADSEVVDFLYTYYSTLDEEDDAAHAELLADEEGIDAAFAEDAQLDLPYENQAGNEDEIAALTSDDSYLVTEYELKSFIVSDDMVIVYYSASLSGDAIPGATPGSTATIDAVDMYTIECGEITNHETLSDSLEALMSLGFTLVPATEATPVP